MYAYNPNTASETVALIEFEKKKEEERRMMINREIDVRMRLVFVGKIRNLFLAKFSKPRPHKKKKVLDAEMNWSFLPVEYVNYCGTDIQGQVGRIDSNFPLFFK